MPEEIYHVFKNGDHCVQFDNDHDAETFAAVNPDAVEISTEVITTVFGDNVRDVGPHNTTIKDDKIIFTNEINTIAEAESIRAKRDMLLTACDWTQIPDAPLNSTQKQAWTDYRQSLRNIPQQNGFPMEITWPAIPA